MDIKQKNFLILVTCAIVYGSIAFLFLIYCCRILLKCKIEKHNEREENEMKSHVSGFSEISASVCMDDERKAQKINEGYIDEISVEDNAAAMKTFSNADGKEEGQVSHQLPFMHREDERQDTFINKQGSQLFRVHSC